MLETAESVNLAVTWISIRASFRVFLAATATAALSLGHGRLSATCISFAGNYRAYLRSRWLAKLLIVSQGGPRSGGPVDRWHDMIGVPPIAAHGRLLVDADSA